MISPLKWKLHTQILIGLVLGALAGMLIGPSITVIRPFGTLFIRLITMIVVPLVFASLVVGTASLDDIRKLGRIGIKTVLYFTCTTAIAISLGVFLAKVLGPGRNLDPETKSQLLENYNQVASENIQKAIVDKPGLTDIFVNIVPDNPFRALAEGDMLEVIFFGLFLGIAITLLPKDKQKPLVSFFDSLSETMIQIVHIVMKMAPVGVFALIAAIIGEFGIGILLTLLKYTLVTLAGLAIHGAVVYPLAMKLFSTMTFRKFFTGMRDAQVVAFSTSSSSATLPVTMECAEEKLGVPREIASFVLPIGTTINMDGTALYQGVAAIFISQVYGMDLSITNQLLIVVTATLASIGAAGVPGVGIITLTLVLKTIGVPLEGIALIIGVDRILDMCRTVINVTGDASCSVVIAATEKVPGFSKSSANSGTLPNQ